MYKFFLNWMGPTAQWYKTNLIPSVKVSVGNDIKGYTQQPFPYYLEHYSCGRIDVSGGDLMFNHEISVPIMKDTSWRKLMVWLHDLELDYIPMGEGIFTMFEEDTGHKIEWWNK